SASHQNHRRHDGAPAVQEEKVTINRPDQEGDTVAVAKIFDETSGPKPKKSGAEAVAGTYTDELVIALCGPIGSPMHDVAGALQEQLEQFGYDCFRIQLSHYIEKHA